MLTHFRDRRDVTAGTYVETDQLEAPKIRLIDI